MIFTKQLLTTVFLGVGVLYYARIKILSFFKKKSTVDTVLFFSEECNKYITRTNSTRSCGRNTCYSSNRRYIMGILQNAKCSIDIAMHFFQNLELAGAIMDAFVKNNVKVRLICNVVTTEPTEGPTRKSSYKDYPKALQLLRENAGERIQCRCIKLKKSTSIQPNLMHHKFVVIDGSIVITGSMNWLDQSELNCVEATVTSEAAIVKAFDEEFQRLWEIYSSSNDPDRRLVPPIPSVSEDWKRDAFHRVFMFGEHTYACRHHITAQRVVNQESDHWGSCAYFVLKKICSLIETAEESISVCLPSLALSELALCLGLAFHKGLTVRIIISEINITDVNSQLAVLSKKGLDIQVMQSSKLQHSFIILDDRLVLFGSLDWSRESFCGNYENLVCTTREEIVGKYNEHFEELWR